MIFGGVNIRPQTEALLKGCDFLIATPGRLLDHAGQLNVDLSEVEFLILDEADRMLDMGFFDDIMQIVMYSESVAEKASEPDVLGNVQR